MNQANLAKAAYALGVATCQTMNAQNHLAIDNLAIAQDLIDESIDRLQEAKKLMLPDTGKEKR